MEQDFLKDFYYKGEGSFAGRDVMYNAMKAHYAKPPSKIREVFALDFGTMGSVLQQSVAVPTDGSPTT